MATNPTVIFSTGNRIFKNATPLNEPPPPIDCNVEVNCIRAATGYRSIYDPKKKKCVCVKFQEATNSESCEERNPEFFGYNKYVITQDDCCCGCDNSLKKDCEDRGWTYVENFSTFNPQSCKCDCEQRNIFDESLYISEENCPPGRWDSDRCYCDCAGSCYEGQTMGPNCICTCDPLIIPPSGCGTDEDGKTGIFDNRHCQCIYPCQPGTLPYFCITPNGDRFIGCSDCKENEHLSPCDSSGRRHCCEYGYVYKEDDYGIGGKCVECTPNNYPSCGGNINRVNPLTCECCPPNYIWDVENQICIISCLSVTDPDNGGSFPASECVSPREITEECECVCPDNQIWGYDIDSEQYACLSPEDRCPEYDPETGEAIGPVDEDGNPLYTRWDSIDGECQCAKGNQDVNDCQPYRYLDTETCECYCPEGRIESGDPNASCNCEENKVENRKTFRDIQGSENLRLTCVTCTELLGEFANPDTVTGEDLIDRCTCQDGYRQDKAVVDVVDILDTIVETNCVTCADYTPNGAWTGTECGCSPGYIKVDDPDAVIRNGEFKCILDESTTSPTTPAPDP